MKAVLTADIINSSQLVPGKWQTRLQTGLAHLGKKGENWDIYRGDELQLLPEKSQDAFIIAIKLKAMLKEESMDARISIGLGTEDYTGSTIRESNGTAFVYSGRNLEELKKSHSQSLSIKSDFQDFDENFNLIFMHLENAFQRWTQSTALAISSLINFPELKQREIATKIGVSQGAFSRSLKRGNAAAIMETDRYFRKKIAGLK